MCVHFSILQAYAPREFCNQTYLSLYIYCRVPARWGLQQTTLGSGQRQDTGSGILWSVYKWTRPTGERGSRAFGSPPPMSSRHRNLEPLERWHATIYTYIYMYSFIHSCVQFCIHSVYKSVNRTPLYSSRRPYYRKFPNKDARRGGKALGGAPIKERTFPASSTWVFTEWKSDNFWLSYVHNLSRLGVRIYGMLSNVQD